jgi:hypothetical protein
MAEPLLSSLCRICHTNSPKYRCPRCSSQTCSLACSKRHKLWSDCNGVRDPTVYKPRHELATPAGIDHDYNFISSIERGIERTDRLIIDEKGLVDRKELMGHGDNRRWKGQQHTGGDSLLEKALERLGVIVDKAPKGMKRNRDNSTNWSKHQKCINWQVEWIKDDGSRVLGKVLEIHPIGEAYAALQEEQRRASMTAAERKQDKKRRATEIKRVAKKARVDSEFDILTQISTMQNPDSSAWDQVVVPEFEEADGKSGLGTDSEFIPTPSYDSVEASTVFYFYLHRPYTTSSNPRVLIPLSSSEPLSTLLRNRVVLEYPTIYAITSLPNSLPDKFMLEDDYLQRKHLDPSLRNTIQEDVDMEEGEIA